MKRSARNRAYSEEAYPWYNSHRDPSNVTVATRGNVHTQAGWNVLYYKSIKSGFLFRKFFFKDIDISISFIQTADVFYCFAYNKYLYKTFNKSLRPCFILNLFFFNRCFFLYRFSFLYRSFLRNRLLTYFFFSLISSVCSSLM